LFGNLIAVAKHVHDENALAHAVDMSRKGLEAPGTFALLSRAVRRLHPDRCGGRPDGTGVAL